MNFLIRPLVAFFLGINVVNANTISSGIAQTVASNFYKQNSQKQLVSIALAYTEVSTTGEPDYFVFNMNDKEGFVIVSAEDAGHPIIGYSTEGAYVLPSMFPNSDFAWWMEQRKIEIEYLRTHNIQADLEITNEWNRYLSNTTTAPQIMGSVAPLCSTNWNQNGYYNDSCPGNSLTGCVATSMAMIMKKWNFPSQGTGSSSYTSASYGTLSANYGATTYDWANMPNALSAGSTSAQKKAVATLIYHCGVSMRMFYTPSLSTASILGGQPSAQYSYYTYFGYNPYFIKGVYRGKYTDLAWITLLKDELNNGRPIQYVGSSSTGSNTHAWVCDGYDANNKFHMNWGWGGSSNGYFSINNLNAGGYNFSNAHNACIGIQPQAALDAGISSVVSPGGAACNYSFTPVVKLRNFGSSVLTSCTINYRVDNNADQTFSWTGSLASGASADVTLPSMTASAGTHTFTGFSSNPNGSLDGNPGDDQSQSTFNIISAPMGLPLAEGFESSINLPSDWSLFNPGNNVSWTISTTVAHSGTHSIAFDNCSPAPLTYEKDKFMTTTYDFSNATSANMSFDVASAPFQYFLTIHYDTLTIFSSIDCGNTWNQLYMKTGPALATAPTYTPTQASPCWSPAASQWRTDNISLNSFNGQPSVMFAFEHRGVEGNWMYIDNININAATGMLENTISIGSIENFPNPFTTSTTFSFSSEIKHSSLVIYDLAGKEVMRNSIPDGAKTFILIRAALSTGMYFYRVVSVEKNISIGKLVVKD